MGSVLQVVGAITISVGVALWSVPAALIVGGVFVLIAGLAVSR